MSFDNSWKYWWKSLKLFRDILGCECFDIYYWLNVCITNFPKYIRWTKFCCLKKRSFFYSDFNFYSKDLISYTHATLKHSSKKFSVKFDFRELVLFKVLELHAAVLKSSQWCDWIWFEQILIKYLYEISLNCFIWYYLSWLILIRLKLFDTCFEYKLYVTVWLYYSIS